MPRWRDPVFLCFYFSEIMEMVLWWLVFDVDLLTVIIGGTQLHVFCKVASLALWQRYDCSLCANNVGKVRRYLTTTKYNKQRITCIFFRLNLIVRCCHMYFYLKSCAVVAKRLATFSIFTKLYWKEKSTWLPWDRHCYLSWFNLMPPRLPIKHVEFDWQMLPLVLPNIPGPLFPRYLNC